MPQPVVLTDKDFADYEHIEGYDDRFVLVLAHTNLLDETAAAPDDMWREMARDFFQMAQRIAEEFPEIQVGLFNSRAHESMAWRLSVLFSYSTYECWAVVFSAGCSVASTAAQYDETPDTFRTWLLGLLFAWGFRRPQSLDEASVWLAYSLCEHPQIDYGETRWNDEGMRMRAVEAVKRNFGRLHRQWHPGLYDDALAKRWSQS